MNKQMLLIMTAMGEILCAASSRVSAQEKPAEIQKPIAELISPGTTTQTAVFEIHPPSRPNQVCIVAVASVAAMQEKAPAVSMVCIPK